MSHKVLVVDNRVFLRGLDTLYRNRVKVYERGRLRLYAQEVANALVVGPADVPIEGYYASEPALTEYFRLVRALQEIPSKREAEVCELNGFRRLREALSSPLYGSFHDDRYLFPRGRNALFFALQNTAPDWTIPRIMDAAHAVAIASTDLSLVALTCLARDPVMIASAAESTVLYEETAFVSASGPIEPEYVWRVDEIVEERASRFVETFNALFGEDLPRPSVENAHVFWNAAKDESIVGRCVCIAVDPQTSPPRYYHWAVDEGEGSEYVVRDFWDTEIWTTAQYTRVFRQRASPRQ